MKPSRFRYIRAQSVEHAASVKGDHDGDAVLLAGGQSLVPMLNFRLVAPSAIVDLNAIPGLDRVEVTETDVRVGALVRQRELELHDGARRACPVLAEALAHVGHPAIRNRGTVAGSVAHADPAAELPTVLAALDGRVRASGRRGERAIPADELFVFHFTTSLEPDEVVTAVEFPTQPPRSGSAFAEVARRHGDYALAGVCAVVALDEEGRLTGARVACSGIGSGPVRSAEAEQMLAGQRPQPELLAEAGETLAQLVETGDHEQASRGYRRQLVRVLAARALASAARRAAEGTER
jgi:carbon-monoxide dehydrogenase medium subunit